MRCRPAAVIGPFSCRNPSGKTRCVTSPARSAATAATVSTPVWPPVMMLMPGARRRACRSCRSAASGTAAGRITTAAARSPAWRGVFGAGDEPLFDHRDDLRWHVAVQAELPRAAELFAQQPHEAQDRLLVEQDHLGPVLVVVLVER